MAEKPMGFQDLLKKLKETDPFNEKKGFLGDCGGGVIGDLRYDRGWRIVERFAGALFTDQLIILCGPPGTGKTSLPFAFAEKIGAECVLIPVQPNWTDNQDLMGYFNPKDHYYVSTPFLDVILRANAEPDKVFFLVLDEMNLAHIEYYFSTMLSVMERNAGNVDGDKREPLRLYSEKEFERVPETEREGLIPPVVPIPKNVQIIGTLNMDETTKGISPKVVDRSYILEIVNEEYTIGNGAHRDEEWTIASVKNEVKDKLDVLLSCRLEKQFETMAGRKHFLNLDDFIAGKVLPMITNKSYPKSSDIVSDFEDYPITHDKLERMKEEKGDVEVFSFWR